MTANKNFKRRVRQRAARTGESYSTSRARLLGRAHGADRMQEEHVAVSFAKVVRHTTPRHGDVPVVELREHGGNRSFVFIVGEEEGAAIARAAQSEPVADGRPRTHDMLQQAVAALGGRVVRVVVHQGSVDDTWYSATVDVMREDGAVVAIDSRPSDAVALAVRCDPAPSLFVTAALMDRDGRAIPGE